MALKPVKNNKGFTLLEVITAIFILTVGVGGSVLLTQQTLSASSVIESKLVAAYLAQEGVEIIRNVRDANWLENRTTGTTSWKDGLTNCGGVNCCEGDYNTDTAAPEVLFSTGCDFDTLRPLNVDDNGFFSYSPGTTSKFKRKIAIQELDENRIEVTAEVLWKERDRAHSIRVMETLTNWYQQ